MVKLCGSSTRTCTSLRALEPRQVLDICVVNRERVGVLFVDGRYIDTLPPGQYAFWKGTADARVVEVDMRDTMLTPAGQETTTVSNALRMDDYEIALLMAHKVVRSTDDVRQGRTVMVSALRVVARCGTRCIPDRQGCGRRRPRAWCCAVR